MLHQNTWEFDGSVWRRLELAGPPARQAHVMVYDERRGTTLVFGGMGAADSGPPPTLGDTWEFDGSVWRRIELPMPR